jgi:hypothetical protein
MAVMDSPLAAESAGAALSLALRLMTANHMF